MKSKIKKARKKLHEDVASIYFGKPLFARITLWIIIAILAIDLVYRFLIK